MKEGLFIQSKIETLAKHLVKNNIKPSIQRLKILEYITNNHSHPTVDQVFKEVSRMIPTLSKTTVYNTLSLFVDANILRKLGIEENILRYDRVLDDHGHFKCSQCEEIYDFAVDVGKLQSEELIGFQTKEINIYFKGLCPKCAGDSAKQKGVCF